MRDWPALLRSFEQFIRAPSEGRWRGLVKVVMGPWFICGTFGVSCDKCPFQIAVVFEPFNVRSVQPHSCAFYPTSFACHLSGAAKRLKVSNAVLLTKLHMYYLEAFPHIEEVVQQIIETEEKRMKDVKVKNHIAELSAEQVTRAIAEWCGRQVGRATTDAKKVEFTIEEDGSVTALVHYR